MPEDIIKALMDWNPWLEGGFPVDEIQLCPE